MVQQEKRDLINDLENNGWKTEDGRITWKRGDHKIAFDPTGWVLAKLNISAPGNYIVVASGISVAELVEVVRNLDRKTLTSAPV